MFKNGSMSVTDAERMGCPAAATQTEKRARKLFFKTGK
jgi:hypothetical protein